MSTLVRMYTTEWCSDCRRAKQFMKARHIPFEEIDLETTPGAEEFVKRANDGRSKVPTFEVGGRTFHCSPFDLEKLARELGVEEN
jgi:mycoredoxin